MISTLASRRGARVTQERRHRERLGLGDAGGRLVEEQDRRLHRDQDREFDEPSGARRQVGVELVAVVAESELLGDLVDSS